MIQSQDLVFDGVSVRLYVPEGLEEEDQSPAIVYYHGGGFMLGSVCEYKQGVMPASLYIRLWWL